MTTEFMVDPGSKADLYDFQLAKECADKLHAHYPGHLWAVNVNSELTGGVVNIFNFAISSRYGYVLHLTTVEADPTRKCVIKAGGEILERAHMARGKSKGDTATVIDDIPDKHQPTKSGIIQ
ncbi:MAG: hypothetical protein OES84_00150 [Kiritimatiellaceae bacterium]|nr:hypothetical protein [Kiritimatiellaceae bacterium]